MKMLPPLLGETPERSRVYRKTRWVRVPPNAAGVFLTSKKPGDVVHSGDEMGKIVDPMTDQEFPILSPNDGEIIGMVVPTIVYTGDGLFHLGLEQLPA